jgi:hypothetical protein
MSKSTAAGRELALASRDVELQIGETASVLPKSLLHEILAMSNGDWPVGKQRHLAHRLWVLHGGRLNLRDIESTRVCFEDYCAHSYHGGNDCVHNLKQYLRKIDMQYRIFELW